MDERVNLILNTVTKGADSLASTVNQLRLLRTQVIGVINIIKEITAYTDRYISSQNVLNNALGNTTEKLDKYTQSLAKMTGISTVNISEKTALFANMAKSLGMANDIAEDFVIQLDDMSAKMALLYGGGKGFENYAKAMLDAVKGESSTLATMTGIVLKTASLQNTLDELGIDLQAKSLNGASRAMVQYITIARQMNATNADLQKSANNVAWQKQLLKNQVRELALAFSNLLYPILKAILPVLNGILIAITTIINTLSRLFGITDTITDSVVASTNAVNDLGDGVVSTSNKIKRSLRGFDKLNNITTPTPTSSSAGTGAGIDPRILEEFAKMQDNLLNIKTRAHEIADAILKWLGFTENENGELEFTKVTMGTIVGGAIGLAVILGKIFGFVSRIGGLLSKLGIGKSLPKIIGSLKKIPSMISGITKALGSVGIGGSLAIIVGVIGGIGSIVNWLEDVVKMMNELRDGKNLQEVLIPESGAEFLERIFKYSVIGGLVRVIEELFHIDNLTERLCKNIENWWNKYIQPHIDRVSRTGAWLKDVFISPIERAFQNIKDYFTTNVVNGIIEPFKKDIGVVVDKIVEIKNKCGEVFDAINTIFETYIKNPLADWWENTVLSWAYNFNENVLKPMGIDLETFKAKLETMFTNLGTRISDFFTDSWKTLINYAFSRIEDRVNRFIRGINTLISVLNIFPEVNIEPLNYLYIPRLETRENGGFVDSGEIYMARENGLSEFIGRIGNRTAVANNDQIVEAVASGVSRAINTSKLGSGTTYVKAVFGSDEVTDWVVAEKTKRDRQYGF